MSLILKSNKVSTNSLSAKLEAYKARVLADGGTISNEGSALRAMLFVEFIGLDTENIHSMTSPEWGVKIVSGNVVKIYDLFNPNGDVNVTKGQYPLSISPTGVHGFKSVGSSNNSAQTTGNLYGNEAGYFAALNPVLNTTTITTVASIDKVLGYPESRILVVQYSHVRNTYQSSAYLTSGEITEVVGGTNIGYVISSAGLRSYQNGSQLSIDSDVVPLSPDECTVCIACVPVSSTISGLVGDYYLNIVTKSTTEIQNRALSKFVADFA